MPTEPSAGHSALLTKPSRQGRQADAKILRVRPLVSARRIVSRRNFGVGLFPFPIKHLPVPRLVLCTFSGQVHYRQRHKVGNMFARLIWCRISTRYNKYPISFFEALAPAATVIYWSCVRNLSEITARKRPATAVETTMVSHNRFTFLQRPSICTHLPQHYTDYFLAYCFCTW